ncbi:MAG TPA: bifunctional pyr operon transcriptional regulator/uracil phosphoribosyltransferase PyrR [Flavobacteriales bacterium]|nr:bifunctional pyr operon transcriptional regulator/uracil phosphoribosyltransferase PyrR [Flavobacteriales bacterium]
MRPRTILNSKDFKLTISRLCHQLIENHGSFENTALVGIQPRGTFLAERIKKQLSKILDKKTLLLGAIDPTFSRDDFRRRKNIILPKPTNMEFIVEDKDVILIDDVLFTGRTVRAGLDEILAYGRPAKVELLVLIDRRFSRHLPIEPNYVGKTIDSIKTEKIRVEWKEIEGEDQVILQKI